MFRAEPMMRARVLALRRDEEVVLRTIGDLGSVHLVASTPSGAGDWAIEHFDAERARWEALRARCVALREAFGSSYHNQVEGALMTDRGLDEWAGALRSIEEQVRPINEAIAGIDRELESRERWLLDWGTLEGLDLVEGDRGSESLAVSRVGSIQADSVEETIGSERATVSWIGPPVADRRVIWCRLRASETDRVDGVLLQVGFRPLDERVPEGLSYREWVERKRAMARELTKERGDLLSRRARLAADSWDLVFACEREAGQQCRATIARGNFARSREAIVIDGWIPRRRMEECRECLVERTAGRVWVDFARPRAGDDPPVLLPTTRGRGAFARLVMAYAIPRRGELVPTVVMSATFLIMFGVMFGDVVHGCALLLAALWGLRRWPKGAWRDGAVMLAQCGLSAIAFGFLYGSAAGVVPSEEFAMWKDPLAGDPMDLIGGSIGIGAVVITTGLLFAILNAAWRNDWWEVVFGKFGVAGVLFYLGLVGGIAPAIWSSAPRVGGMSFVLMGLGVAGWVIFDVVRRAEPRGEFAEGWFTRAGLMVADVFEGILVYFANTISFVRLAAYAMSHAALVLTITVLAESVHEAPLVGGVAAFSVWFVGNAAVIALEGTIAAVQALRLEYYEFFGKFMVGGGVAYAPFRWDVSREVV